MPRLLILRAGAYVFDVVLLFLVRFPVGQLLRFAIGLQPPSSPSGLGIWLASACIPSCRPGRTSSYRTVQHAVPPSASRCSVCTSLA